MIGVRNNGMGWLGANVTLTGWLIKEIWSNVTQTRFMRRQYENEHQYFKKRLIYEQKNEIYKELYKRLKHMVGVMNDFQFFDERVMLKNQDAMNHHVLSVKVNDETFDSAKFVDEYNNIERVRLEVNLNYYFVLLNDKYLGFKNYVSEQNYILTQEENNVIYEIDNCYSKLYRYIEECLYNFKEDVRDPVIETEKHFGISYSERFKELDELTYKFAHTIRKEMFL